MLMVFSYFFYCKLCQKIWVLPLCIHLKNRFIFFIWHSLITFKLMAASDNPEQNEHRKHVGIHKEVYQYHPCPVRFRLLSDPTWPEFHGNGTFRAVESATATSQAKLLSQIGDAID